MRLDLTHDDRSVGPPPTRTSRARPAERRTGARPTAVPWYAREIALGPVWGLAQRRRLFAELATMLTAGLDLRESLMLVGPSLSPRAAASVSRILRGYEAGQTLASVFAGEGFGGFEVEAIAVGERASELPRVCRTVASFHERILELRGKIVAALSYPAFVLAVSLGVLYFLLEYLVPTFAETFARGGMTLPPLTVAVQRAAEVVGAYTPLALVALAVGTTAVYLARGRAAVRKAAGYAQLRLPVLSGVTYHLALARVCHSIHRLLSNGVDLVRALEFAARSAGIHQLQLLFAGAAADTAAGSPLYACLEGESLLPRRFAALVRIAESTHTLPDAFARLASAHESEADEASERLKTFIEPVLILGLGLIVGVVLIAMYMPLFSMSSAAR